MSSTCAVRWLNNGMKQEPITFTESAQEHFANAVKSENALGVRLSLAGGGCAGFSYKWELIQSPSQIDMTEYSKAFDGWVFWLDEVSAAYLQGSVVDKKSSIAGSFIDISSPLAASACGCGESISFKV
jgi:iron-sulfur cluster assembly accessory protein